MSFVAVKGDYHIALDGVGLLLTGAPDRPAYRMMNAPVYGTRFASGDRDYNDFSQYWYLTETDWSGGFKDTFPFADDAKYYYSSNIDARSKPGTISLEKQVALVLDNNVGGNDEVFDVKVLPYGASGASVTAYIANDSNDLKNLSNGSDVFSSGVGNKVKFAHSHRQYLWVLGGTGGTGSVTADNAIGGAATSKVALINTQIGGSVDTASVAVSIGDVLYIFGISTTGNIFCVKTSVANPTAAGDFTVVFEIPTRNNLGASVVGAKQIGGSILFLIEGSPQWSLFSLDTATSIATLLKEFDGCDQLGVYDAGSKYVQIFDVNKLLITIITDSTNGKGSIWEYNGTTLTKIYDTDAVKYGFTLLSKEAVGFLRGGAVIHGSYAHWGNLVYDGTHVYNFIKDVTDAITNVAIPVGSDGTLLYSVDLTTVSGDDQTAIYSYNPIGTTYKDGANNEAFLVMSQHDKIQSIDKLLNAITIGFEQFLSGQSIAIYYTTAPLPLPAIGTWTLLGTASHALDGASVVFKTLPFPVGIVAKKVWFRIQFVGGGGNTPTLTDFTLEYLPMPDYKKQWTLNINCADELKRLSGALVATTGRELKSRIERAWWTKSQLDFQDLDYATTLVNDASFDATETTVTVDSTYDFPEQGRIRVDDEEITYTGKTPTTFTGCTRGARGTRGATHADDAVVNNAYRVIILDMDERAPILLEDKNVEYSVGLTLREV